MSRMSQLHMELSEQAYGLGFIDIEDAENHGWRVNYEQAKLEPPVVQPSLDEMKEQEKAHEAWQKEREEVLEEQRELHDRLMELGYDALAESVWHAIKFIQKGEC